MTIIQPTRHPQHTCSSRGEGRSYRHAQTAQPVVKVTRPLRPPPARWQYYGVLGQKWTRVFGQWA